MKREFIVPIDYIGDIPPDNEEIIRCKDCEHSEPWYGDKSRCFLWHETGIDVFNDGFCNYGKSKEKETNMVEVVRCKDCKYYQDKDKKYDFAMCSELDICVDSGFYCKYWNK